METFEYRPINVCSTKMIFKLENNIIKEVQVIGGCAGNSLGLCRLLKDQPIETIIAKLKGTRCRTNPTSCPDQIATALELYLDQKV